MPRRDDRVNGVFPLNLRDIYYDVKPVMPRPFQVALRRQFAGVWRKVIGTRWPIDPAASAPPSGWRGWPEDKKFALVLTHDVEGAEGQSKCLELMAMEQSRGFRSSFNFVAEGYEVSEPLRRHLAESGFEVGVHGIRHDGKDFKSRRIFETRAPKINRYLKEWQAVGFRAPATYCKFDWLHELDIEYDSSTFDTDPFELGSEASRTIFPFFVREGVNGNGFVELPYTLPQDFTLFVIMREKNLDVWKRKLDWIARHGGMALMLTHPDYMNFNGRKSRVDEYPAGLYEQFLDHIKSKYEGQFWNPLPREVAGFWKERKSPGSHPRPVHRPLRVCMLSYSFYQSDNRVIRYAETLAKRGDQVDVISLRRNGMPDTEMVNGVQVFMVQERVKDEKKKLDYLKKILGFFYRSAALVSKLHFQNPYDLIHVHSVPDFEVFAALLPKLGGAKVILDIHDIVPELFASKFGGGASVLFKLLRLMEKISIKFSDHVIISNHLWRDTLIARSVEPEKCTAVLNYPDPEIFYRRTRQNNGDKTVILYPGTLNWHQGLDIAIKAFALIKDKAPDAVFHIYGEGSSKEALARLIDDLHLNDRVFLKGLLPIRDIAPVMAGADIGIVPKRDDGFGNEAFSTKILEFMSLGVPVVVASTKVDRYYFNDSVARFFTSGSVEDLAASLEEVLRDKSRRETLAQSGFDFSRKFSWDCKKDVYLDLVESILS